jgi:hypothetical protein
MSRNVNAPLAPFEIGLSDSGKIVSEFGAGIDRRSFGDKSFRWRRLFCRL